LNRAIVESCNRHKELWKRGTVEPWNRRKELLKRAIVESCNRYKELWNRGIVERVYFSIVQWASTIKNDFLIDMLKFE